MLQALEEELNYTATENGALTLRSSGSACLDLFATIGALRQAEEAEITARFEAAFTEDPDLAMKLLFFARDVRGGLGERRVFQVIYGWLLSRQLPAGLKNLALIPEYGRYDDLASLLVWDRQHIVPLVAGQLHRDLFDLAQGREVSLLAKWLPSVNASAPATRRLALSWARALGYSAADYRKTLSTLRQKLDLLENRLRKQDYTFDYEKQPSKALFKYQQAFWRHDQERYQNFLERVSRGEAVLKTGSLYPYELVNQILLAEFRLAEKLSPEQEASLDVTWKALPDYTRGEQALVVVDGSGSMYGGQNPLPISLALSLGIYFAQRNQGEFHNCFVTFSEHPRLVKVKGATLARQVRHCLKYNECANTNVAAVFKVILQAALRHHLSSSELPATLYIISDMEFDECAEGASLTNFEAAKQAFAAQGYKLPRVVFWNVSSRHRQQPVRQNEQGVALVSGASPKLFELVLDGELDPYAFMLQVLQSARYAKISA